MASGTIYIVINEAMPAYVKIGKTEGPLETRMRGLDTTGVPLPSKNEKGDRGLNPIQSRCL